MDWHGSSSQSWRASYIFAVDYNVAKTSLTPFDMWIGPNLENNDGKIRPISDLFRESITDRRSSGKYINSANTLVNMFSTPVNITLYHFT